MSAADLNLNYNEPKFELSPGSTTLAVVLHAFRSTSQGMAEVIAAVREEFKNDVDIFAPTLPYEYWWDSTSADDTVVNLVADLDEIWDGKKSRGKEYQRVIFIGHSLGGIISRRVFLAGSPNPTDYDGVFAARDDLWEKLIDQRKRDRESKGLPKLEDKELPPSEWAAKVNRIILLASWDKGWSVSPGTGWLYGIGLNTLGIIGRLQEICGIQAKLGSTMLDMRQGARFIVQTRLLWMAYRRWLNKDARTAYQTMRPSTLADPPGDATNPLVVQIIGSLDDFVPPQDQIDLDAEGVMAWLPSDGRPMQKLEKKNYFLLEMADADHGGVVKFAGNPQRKELLFAALKKDQDEIEKEPDDSAIGKALRKPVNFLDAPPEVYKNVERVVFVIHGIRDDGYWTHRIAEAIKREWERNKIPPSWVHTYYLSHGVETLVSDEMMFYPSWTQTYGYFAMLPFVLPWVRKSKVEWFMDKYVSVKAAYPNATFDYVGHSNGTYLAACALRDYPAARFGNIYFAGSVVHPQFKWSEKVDKGQVKKFHNARGGEDWVVALLPKSLEYFTDLGGAGFDGFDDAEKCCDRITQSRGFAKGGHGGAIGEKHWGEIAKFIVRDDAKPFGSCEPGSLFARHQDWFYKFVGALRIGVPIGFAMAALIVLLAVSSFVPNHSHWGVPLKIWSILLVALLVVAAVFWILAKVISRLPTNTPWTDGIKFVRTQLSHLLMGSFVALSLWSLVVAVAFINPPGWLLGQYDRFVEFFAEFHEFRVAAAIANPFERLWGIVLAAFMILQFFSVRCCSKRSDCLQVNDRFKLQEIWRQRAPAGGPKIFLTLLFIGLAVSFVLWFVWALASVFAELSGLDARQSNLILGGVKRTALFGFGEVVVLWALTYMSRAPSGLFKRILTTVCYLIAVVLLFWFVYPALLVAFRCVGVDFTMTAALRSGLAVATFFVLAALVRFILTRV